MKTLTELINDPHTSRELLDELNVINRNGNHEDDYITFYFGTMFSKNVRSNAQKKRAYYMQLGYKITGEYSIPRNCLSLSLGYEHSGYAGVMCLRKESHVKQSI